MIGWHDGQSVKAKEWDFRVKRKLSMKAFKLKPKYVNKTNSHHNLSHSSVEQYESRFTPSYSNTQPSHLDLQS